MNDGQDDVFDSIIFDEDSTTMTGEATRASDIYGQLTFTGDVMLKRLPPEVFMVLEKRSRVARRLTPKSRTPLQAQCATGRLNSAAPTTAIGSNR